MSDSGSALVSVTVASMVIGMLASLMLTTGDSSNTGSIINRNHEAALGVAEAGVHHALAKLEEMLPTMYVTGFTFDGDTPQGSYDVVVSRTDRSVVVDSTGRTEGEQLGRARRIRATLRPPRMFGEGAIALFSQAPIELKNNNIVDGDVWSNSSILTGHHVEVDGSITSAQGWIELGDGTSVSHDVWSGGGNGEEGWAVRLGNGTHVHGNVKASVAVPSDPESCGGVTWSTYDVSLGNGVVIDGSVTTLGGVDGAGQIAGPVVQGTCTVAATARAFPPFTFDPHNYDPDSYHEFSSSSAFAAWLEGAGNKLEGTFVVMVPSPSQANRIDLSGASVIGDTTIITNAPIFTGSVSDETLTGDAVFVLVSRYDPPPGTACNVNQDASECAIHLKNGFDVSCRTGVLIYADNGPVAVKNNAKSCGSIVADGVLIKNGQHLSADPRVERIAGFGGRAFEVERWEESPA